MIEVGNTKNNIHNMPYDPLIHGNSLLPQLKNETFTFIDSPLEFKPKIAPVGKTPPSPVQFDIKSELSPINPANQTIKREAKVQPHIYVPIRESPKSVNQTAPKKAINPTIKKAKNALPYSVKISNRDNLVNASQISTTSIPVHRIVSDKNIQPFVTPFILPPNCTSSGMMYTTSPVQGIVSLLDIRFRFLV